MPVFPEARVRDVRSLGAGYHGLVVSLGGAAVDYVPGQFAMVRVPGGWDPLLRRPLGLADLRLESGETMVEFVFRVVGRGTAQLGSLRPGDLLDVIAPLGRGFPNPAPGEQAVLVAGGYGVAPLYGLARRAVGEGRARGVRLFYGARSAADLLLLDRFADLGVEVHLATEDGSRGTRGTVVDALEKADLGPSSRIYACGPEPMLASVSGLAAARGLPAWVSLEARMACGTGLCLGCARPGADGRMRMVCGEGPAFPAEEIFGGGAEAKHERP